MKQPSREGALPGLDTLAPSVSQTHLYSKYPVHNVTLVSGGPEPALQPPWGPGQGAEPLGASFSSSAIFTLKVK